MNHLRISIAVTDPAQQEILIAFLSELGYEGFEQEEDVLQAYLPESGFDAAALAATLQPYHLAFTTAPVPEKNWNEEWERNFTPVQIDRFCAIRAHFHPPIPGVTHELIITPKMSFGTGHHATTYTVLRAMEHLGFEGKTVLDFGTGTGVLAILAEKLGAARIEAIDIDDWSIRNANENIAENHCIKVTAKKLDAIPPGEQFDIILANINKHVLLAQMARMAQQLKLEGVILMSGLVDKDFEEIDNQAKLTNLFVAERTSKDGWICLKMEKSPN
ncbi:MAG TPA: 50S ribosomal protein L11 methyltransferase [Puia sp.]|nr:50S ribosomal protein L11 methyltransferase [Puia sp.]